MVDARRVRPEDIGFGAFYYSVSVPIINIMTFAGFSRDSSEVKLFFLALFVVLIAMRAAVAFCAPLRAVLEVHVEPCLPFIAALAVLFAGLAVLDVVGLASLVACAFCTAVACSVSTGLWASSPSVQDYGRSAFQIPAALYWAVGFYLAYRLLQFLSLPVASGWLVAVPLIGMMTLLMAYAPDYVSLANEPNRWRAFALLGIVVTVFAVAAGILGDTAGMVSFSERMPFTFMVVLEAVGALTIGLLCRHLVNIDGRSRCQPRWHRVVRSATALLPPFLIGCASGIVPIPGDSSNFLWEASIWVLLIGVLIYGMRTSLFAVRGIGIGLMWEAWCVGQIAAHIAVMPDGPSMYLVVPLVIAYLAVSIAQTSGIQVAVRGDSLRAGLRGETGSGRHASAELDTSKEPAAEAGIALGLSPREQEVLRLAAEGRSARYIADELTISFNTARSHLRRIYEKLDVHSKQELISLMHDRERHRV